MDNDIDFGKIDFLFKKKNVDAPQAKQEKPSLVSQFPQISSDKSKYVLEREEYDPGRPNDYDEMKKKQEKK